MGTRRDVVTRDELFLVLPIFDVNVVARELLDFVALGNIPRSFFVHVVEISIENLRST